MTTSCHITTVAFGGEGVGRVDKVVFFVPFTLPEETIDCVALEQKPRFTRARLLTVLEANPQRVSPPCPYFTTCGGCQLQHADYTLQLELKRRFVLDALTRIGKISFPVPPVIPSSLPFSYRRHISLKIAKASSKHWELCFSATNGSLLPIYSCQLFHSANDPILSSLQQACSLLSVSEPFEGRLKLVKEPKGYMGAFSFKRPLSRENKKTLYTLFSPHLNQIQIEGDSPIPLSFSCLGLQIFYSPFGFLQNHQEQSEAIYTFALQALKNSTRILDLYCGIGITSLLLARESKKVLGVELNPLAIALAKENSRINGLPSASFLSGAAETVVEECIGSFTPDSVLVNPPKTGLDATVKQALLAPSIQQIVYISCHPPTLARDLSFFLEKGFTLHQLQPFDMFPQTTHVETVCILKR